MLITFSYCTSFRDYRRISPIRSSRTSLEKYWWEQWIMFIQTAENGHTPKYDYITIYIYHILPYITHSMVMFGCMPGPFSNFRTNPHCWPTQPISLLIQAVGNEEIFTWSEEKNWIVHSFKQVQSSVKQSALSSKCKLFTHTPNTSQEVGTKIPRPQMWCLEIRNESICLFVLASQGLLSSLCPSNKFIVVDRTLAWSWSWIEATGCRQCVVEVVEVVEVKATFFFSEKWIEGMPWHQSWRTRHISGLDWKCMLKSHHMQSMYIEFIQF